MNLTARFLWLVVLLGSGLAAQVALSRHLEAVGSMAGLPLQQPLLAVPMTLGPWQGEDIAIENPEYLYADQHLQRVYRNAETGQAVRVWMAYSQSGTDRGHHPEVCMAVAGQPEDVSVRQQLAAAGHDQPIQQFKYGRSGEGQWIFYWYYTLLPAQDPAWDEIQRAYHKLRQRPASVTLEVFAGESNRGDTRAQAVANVQAFVRMLDAATQPIVGPQATRGSDRLAVAVVPTAAKPVTSDQ